MILCVIISPT